MQFQVKGSNIRVLAYRGYDNIKKRAIIKMLGSLEAYSFIPKDGLLENLTEEEKIELDQYVNSEKLKQKQRYDRMTTHYLPSRLAQVAETALNKSYVPTEQEAQAIFAGIDQLNKALRKMGFSRPKTPRNSTLEENQSSLALDTENAQKWSRRCIILASDVA